MKDDFLYFWENSVSGEILVRKLQVKMLSSNYIARFFDHQCIWKESIDILDFLHGYIH